MKVKTLIVVLLLTVSLVQILPPVPAAHDRTVDAPRSTIARPDGFGPYPTGWYNAALTTTTKTYKTNVVVYYPALANGSGTAANMTKAPYPTIIILPFFGGNEMAMGGLAQQISSWGMVAMSVGVNWTDFPDSANITDMEDFLDYLEAENVTVASTLYHMVDKECFGLSGYSSGGGLTLLDSTYVDRIKATETLAAAIGVSTVDVLAADFKKPILLQVGTEDTQYKGGSEEAYKVFKSKRSLVEIVGASHGGPWETYMFPAFYLYIFNRVPEYRTYIYGEEAVKGHATGVYDLYFNLSSTDFFPPYAKAWVNTSKVNMDEPVVFNASLVGYYPPGIPQNNFQWDIDGDGTWDTNSNSSLNSSTVFKAPGTFVPKFGYNIGRFSITALATPVNVLNVPPVAFAGDDITVNEDQLANFDGSMSNDTLSDVLTFKWTFGDGGSRDFSDNPMADHTYKKSGTYTATLTVKDLYGATATDTLTVTVKNVAPKAEAGLAIHEMEDAPVGFMGEGTDTASDQSTLIYKWDFGDGNATDWVQSPYANHVYSRTGNFTATFWVKDSDGAAANDTVRVDISDVNPLAVITSPENGTAVDEDTEVGMVGTGQDTQSDQAGLQYMWDFGDGGVKQWGPSTEASHVYKIAGKYTITFWVRDHDGLMDNSTVSMTVNNVFPVAKITSPNDGLEVAEDQMVSFVGNGTDTPTDQLGLVYQWTIEGTVFTGKEVGHAFTRAGTYDISMMVTDPHGASANATVSIKVTNKAPVITSTIVEPLKFVAGGHINYSVEANDTPSDRGHLTYIWNFGDTLGANDTSGVHTYGVAGTYTVKLTVADEHGAIATKTFTVVVDPAPIKKPPKHVDNGPSIAVYTGVAVVAAVSIGVVAFLLVNKGSKIGKVEKKEEEPENGKGEGEE